MLEAKLAYSPIDPNTKLENENCHLLTDAGRYRKLVKKLNYLTVIRPYISFAISVISHFRATTRTPHWDAVICILKYFKYTKKRSVLK